MKLIYPRILTIASIFFIGILTSFCASKHFLKVNYQLPAEPIQLNKMSVSLALKDQRENPAIVTKSAKMALKSFRGDFTLIIGQENKNDRLAGAYSLCRMIRRIFRERLENAGIRVASEEERLEPIVEILLKEFKLDLVKRKWIVNMTYQANLIKQNRVVAGETVRGSAERMRVVGSKDAEMIIGELITDVVNRLNLNELLQPAGA
jgi:hypothetical protein